MGINKVQYGNTTLIDLTADTVTADKLMQGYTAHDKTGAIITGTATGGGSVTQDQDGFIILPPDGGGSPSVGGLEYEEGTWTPSEDVSRPSIYFANEHASLPLYIMLADATGDSLTSTDTNIAWAFSYYYIFIGDATPVSPNPRYGQVAYMYRGTNNTTTYSTVSSLAYNTSDETDANYVRYWATEELFKPSTTSNTRYWRAGRTYKWIAVWAPTT